MATNQLDLWPTMTATATTQNIPISILLRQADLLQKKTAGLVEAYVKPQEDAWEFLSASSQLGLEGKNTHNYFSYSFVTAQPCLQEKRQTSEKI